MSNDNPDFTARDASDGVAPIFVQRWSPRAYRDEPIPERDLCTIMDAARWSPSCYNEQPWLFITSTPATHQQFVGLLVEANQRWAKSAPVIGFALAAKNFSHNGKANAHAAFDTGAAWMAIALQASMLGYYAHGMGGIEYEAVYQQLGIDAETYQLICGFALGRVDTTADEQITTRKSLQDIWQPRGA